MTAALMGYGSDRRRRRGVSGDATRCAARHGAAPARPEGRLGADQRHAGLDRDRAGRAVRGRARVRCGNRRRRAVGRCAQGQHASRSTRAFPSFAASPGRSASPPPSATCWTAARSSPAMPAAAEGPGPLQLPLPAAGDGRRARPARECRPNADDRSRRGDRQSDRLRRRGRGDFGRQFPRRSRSPSPPTRSPWRLCEVGSSRERRVAVLVDPKMSGLPPFLTEDSGRELRA